MNGREKMNPWKEGDYLCYGEAIAVGEGQFAAYYFVEKTLPGGEIKCVLERRRFGHTKRLTWLALMELVLVSLGLEANKKTNRPPEFDSSRL